MRSVPNEEVQVSRFGLVVRFTLREGQAEAFDALMRETVAGIAEHEPRTLVYAVHALEGEPDVRIFYELYTSEAALAEHESQPTTRRFLDSVGEHVSRVEVQRLHLVTGTGITDTVAPGPQHT
ncbi:putative quinol monooxygenase [Actinotalea subterranea]|uniref:putative quinol monooxygenase n=1 Tax=Actinotalea subterranea TaxID=2607497 RepID=UPI001CAA87C7|nr:antibiotic biosynthesis monooxygenase [Actinotalea subterranea]